ncbi:methyltransferase domain-containing protein [Streptosporangium sp. NBC_01810]|uniref:methyltransferase domain-containing protein n=1 Tax=Streptosporangium sp. NBC_01810 TaxID=2975951 RepID=UPI002DD9B59C|nr:methyltransferase domain-containing protein [Streptosporangium sp. NBC_01810]WSA29432.1 methyltransferase domain-containing protein [Streptosporangium sp. NBC_01810]
MVAPLPVGDGIAARPGGWRFSGAAAHHFDEHAARSIPAYTLGHDLIVSLSDFFVRPGGRVYDVGCSTGALTARLAARHPSATVVGVDVEPDMTAVARLRLAEVAGAEVVDADAASYDFQRADLVVAYYTLQFTPVERRAALVARLAAAVRPGGALLVFEKTLAATARMQDLAAQAYAEHKLSGGYSPSEILAKAHSLRGVLTPLTSAQNVAMLHRAGLESVEVVHRHLLFEGYLAIREASA